jgi:hypothetical protein
MGRGILAVVLACAATPALANPGKEGKTVEPPAPQKHLLDAPVLQTRARALPSFGGGGANVRVTWLPVPGAHRYHAMWSGPDGKPVDTWSNETSFHRDAVAAGKYTLQVAALDATGMEGALAPQLGIEVVDVVAIPPGKTAPEPPTRGAYAVGTRFATEGIACTLGGRTSAERVKGEPRMVRAASPGDAQLRCGDKLVAQLVIAPVIVAAKEAPLPRGQTTTVHVIVASVAAIGSNLTVQPIGDAKLGDVQRTKFGLDVPLAVAAEAQAAAVAVSADGLELGRVGFELVDPPAPPPPPPVAGSAWAAFDLAVVAGAFVPTATGTNTGAPALGHPMSYKDVVGAGPLFGPRLGFFPTPRLGFEIEGAMLTLPTSGDRVAAVAGRGQLALRAVDRDSFGLRLIAGAGVFHTLTTTGTSTEATSGEVHYGFALAVETTPTVSLRVDALDAITTARDGGYAHNLLLELSIATRLGRRDHW